MPERGAYFPDALINYIGTTTHSFGTTRDPLGAMINSTDELVDRLISDPFERYGVHSIGRPRNAAGPAEHSR